MLHLGWTVPAGPADGTSLQGQGGAARPPRATFRVGVCNIRRCLDDNYSLIVPRVADLLRKGDLDLVGLNEVDGSHLLDWHDQAEILGRELGLGWLFAPTERSWGRGAFGNAILSSLPVTQWRRRPLEGSTGVNRNTLEVTVTHQGRPIRVLITHVGRGADRAPQLAEVLSRFLALEPPSILLGDLNTPSDDPQLKELFRMPGVLDVAAGIECERARRIDYVITRGFRLTSTLTLPTFEVYHLLVAAEIEPLPSPTPPTRPVGAAESAPSSEPAPR